ncbi:CopD family protein [Croceicoccus sediminis]|uniref:CopD family protein n=1 Tax=Croceicoccus sediminis TaxID=2571150 RepID=UPI001183F639|nr:CopD family protein [Croceicoccus sediminis]
MDDTNVVLARAALYVVALGLAGIPLYLRISGTVEAGKGLRLAMAAGAIAAAAIAAWWAAASVAAMAALPLGDLDYEMFSAVAGATPIGTVLDVRLAAAIGVLLAAAFLPRTLILGLIAAAIPIAGVWTGHPGAAEGMTGHVQRLFDAIHLLAAAVWFGALIVFLASLIRSGAGRVTLVSRLRAFAATGTVIVATLAVTGTVNGWLIAQHGFAWSSTWSFLLIVKLGLFAAMLAFAAVNRWKLTPAYEAGAPGSAGRLGTSLLLEASCAVGIFALVAIIGLSNPAGAV